jgi:hypothetical protein
VVQKRIAAVKEPVHAPGAHVLENAVILMKVERAIGFRSASEGRDWEHALKIMRLNGSGTHGLSDSTLARWSARRSRLAPPTHRCSRSSRIREHAQGSVYGSGIGEHLCKLGIDQNQICSLDRLAIASQWPNGPGLGTWWQTVPGTLPSRLVRGDTVFLAAFTGSHSKVIAAKSSS